MKKILSLSLILCYTLFGQAQEKSNPDSSKVEFAPIDESPEYPGGIQKFYEYILKNLKYPEIAKLTGINGKVIVSFVVEKDGSLTAIKPLSNVGGGCEEEGLRLLSESKKWKPALQNKRPVRSQYTLPIKFDHKFQDASMKAFRMSNYGFVFEINGKEYLIDKAEEILGKTFPINKIEISIPHPDQSKYIMPGKKEIYLIKIKA